jgi:hypothetical protein
MLSVAEREAWRIAIDDAGVIYFDKPSLGRDIRVRPTFLRRLE